MCTNACSTCVLTHGTWDSVSLATGTGHTLPRTISSTALCQITPRAGTVVVSAWQIYSHSLLRSVDSTPPPLFAPLVCFSICLCLGCLAVGLFATASPTSFLSLASCARTSTVLCLHSTGTHQLYACLCGFPRCLHQGPSTPTRGPG